MTRVLQVVTSVPTAKLPKSCTIGTKKPRPMDADENTTSSEEDELDEMGRRGQILWIRGLTRLQHQVRILHCRH